MTAGQIKRLIINVPPRYMKSLNVSVCWPVWEWGPRAMPHLRYLFSSYAGELVVKHSVDRRTLIESDWHRANWGNVYTLNADNNRKTEFENNQRGVMSTTSPGSTATGKGGNRIVVDDPINPKQALSEAERLSSNQHFDQTLYTRLNDKQQDAIVVIMQRLHTRDLTGHLLEEKKEEGWTHLCLEAEAESQKVISLGEETEAPKQIVFPISGRIVTRNRGDLLWPEREPLETLKKTKATLGSYAYAGQYQQRPAPLEGGVIKRAWWQRFNLATQQPAAFHQLFISADPKFKDYETASHVAIHGYGVIGPNLYLLRRMYDHYGLVETITAILKMRKELSQLGEVGAVIVEDKANGPAVIQVLRKKVSGVLAEEPSGSKEARAIAASPTIEAGNVFVPDEPWGDEVIDAWTFVPNGDNWDDVDAMSQAIKYASRFGALQVGSAEDLNIGVGELESARADW